jgi:hypothetical protein
MTIWFVAAIPVLIMFFALAMERLEHRLRYLAARDNLGVQDHEVDELLARSGIGGTLELFRRRRLRRTAPQEIGPKEIGLVPARHVEQQS